MYDVIFVKLKQNLSMVFGKYQLQYAYFLYRTIVDHAHFYLYYHQIFHALNILCIT